LEHFAFDLDKRFQQDNLSAMKFAHIRQVRSIQSENHFFTAKFSTSCMNFSKVGI